MWCNSKCVMLLLTTTIFVFAILPESQAVIYSNSSILEPVPDDTFCGLPVYFKSNIMIKSLTDKDRMREHIQRILRPLAQYIVSDDVKFYGPKRRSDNGFGPESGSADLSGPIDSNNINGQQSIVQLEQFDLPFIQAAQIGAYTFT